MARLPQEKIDEVRQSVDIVDVIGQYLSLNKKGNNYVAVCPFHDDTNPSLSISQSKQIYMCFVCHNGGNVFTFLQEYLHIPFMEAVKRVAEIGHVDLTPYHLESRVAPVDDKHKVLYDMHEEANKIYNYYLNTKAATLAKDYLKERGFNDEVIKKYGIGYAPNKPVLYEAFTKLGYQEIDMVKSGLVIESERHYDRFRDRITFPLHDEHGRVVGFSGRIYRRDSEEAKYLNSPESDIFIKGRVLYNYHRALASVKKEGFVYINEGFMDVIAMDRAGHPNAIALMGTALTRGHIEMLRRMTRHIVLCLDGDDAGQAAAMKSADFLTANDFDVRLILLPNGRDPDEIYSTDGKNGLDVLLKETMSPLDFMIRYESIRLDLHNYEDRKQLLVKGCQAISTLTDSIDRAHYVEKLAEVTGFSENIVREQLNATAPVMPEYEQLPRQVRKTQELMDKYKRAERHLLFYMLSDKRVSDLYESKVGFMYDDTYRVLASYIVDYYRTHSKMNEADLINRIDPTQEELRKALVDVSACHLPLPYDEKAVNDYMETISQNAVKLKKELLREQFNYVLDPQAKSEILKQIIELEKEKL